MQAARPQGSRRGARAAYDAFDREPQVPNAVPSRGLPFVVFGFAVGAPEQTASLRAELARVVDGLASAESGVPSHLYEPRPRATRPGAGGPRPAALSEN